MSKSSYYGPGFRAGPSLIRARRPYLVRNVVTGLGLWCLVGGIYWYTLRAVGQDDFADVQVPPAPNARPEEK